MRLFISITIFSAILVFAANKSALAVCVQSPVTTFTCNTNPPNPDLTGIQQSGNNNNLTINMLAGSQIDTTAASTKAIDVGDGNNQFTLNNAVVMALDDNGIEAGGGNNIFNIVDSEVRCDDDCIDLGGSGNNNISLLRSKVESIDNNGIDTGNGVDIVMAVDSEILAGPQCCNNFGIQLRGGEDQATIINTRVAGFIDMGTPFAIRMGAQNDIVTLGTGAQIDGLIDCAEDFDTIVFAMDVPEESLAAISGELALKNPAGDSITINGLFYQWEFCEELANELVGVRPPVANVPTLTEWGLIAMSGLMGIVGFIVMRRRKVTA
jgi:hypothetical protein